jgi:hypothetical protein
MKEAEVRKRPLAPALSRRRSGIFYLEGGTGHERHLPEIALYNIGGPAVNETRIAFTRFRRSHFNLLFHTPQNRNPPEG